MQEEVRINLLQVCGAIYHYYCKHILMIKDDQIKAFSQVAIKRGFPLWESHKKKNSQCLVETDLTKVVLNVGLFNIDLCGFILPPNFDQKLGPKN